VEPFIVNSRGRLVFPSNFAPKLDFSLIVDVDQLASVIQRDFETKAPSGADIADKIGRSEYGNRLDLLRDIALNLFWVNRYSVTMYDKRPTRFGDLPKRRDDVFLPVLTPWEGGDATVSAVEATYHGLPAAWSESVEDDLFSMLFDVFAHRRHTAAELPAIKPTVAQTLADPLNRTWRIADYDPDYPTFSFDDIVNCGEDVAELEALRRWAMVLHNQYPWDRAKTDLVEVGSLTDDDYVVAFHPRDSEVASFLRRASRPQSAKRERVVETRQPVSPFPAIDVRAQFAIRPKLEALAVVKGEQTCTNEDLIRNSAYSWSPMSASEVLRKTGIEQRLYTSRSLEEITLEAAEAALAKAGRSPDEIGAVICCTCTSTRSIPSLATWLSGELGMYRTQASYDLIAACAGFPYGLAHATRLLQEVDRPVLVVCVEKFSDKIGTVRPSRMIFGDGAAALVIGPAERGAPGDIDYLQTYASGPVSEVNSIIWPNPLFDNNITLFGPEVKALAGRYLNQMIDELSELASPTGSGSLLDSLELVIPHQANKTMIIELATNAGLPLDRLFFNVETVGNVSAASIPIAIHDAITRGVISSPMRAFCPGFGAGAVAGYAVMTIDPAIAAPTGAAMTGVTAAGEATPHAGDSDDMSLAFGGQP
jgi:3-oxoacyl-[acyl-carrier-protein] synthase-3